VRAVTDARGDRAVAAVAGRQYGVVTRAQLVACGLGDSAIAHRVRTGWLHRIHRGVYVVGHLAPTPLQREIAAVLAAGDDAVVSHVSAAYLWGLADDPVGPAHVTIPSRGCRKPGIRAHRTRALAPRERTIRWGVPVTTPARTIIDMAETTEPTDLEQLIAEARVTKLVSHSQLRAAVAESRGRRGVRGLATILDEEHDPAFTRSEAERRFLSLVRAARLPEPYVNALAAGYEVDFLWPFDRLVVEIDGYSFHGNRGSFERDRSRDAALAAVGLRVMRITWRQLTREPEMVVARLAGALAIAEREGFEPSRRVNPAHAISSRAP
jgi:very-short-patch-repair endonuclease